MSIPPLVCSTPPPPDQCEDDKDPEDFDIHYNLSQEDDDEYDYGNFSSFNHFTSATEKKKDSVLMCNNIEGLSFSDGAVESIPEIIENNTTENHHNCTGTNNTNEISNKSDEDTNVEDLNLELSEDPTIPALKEENECTKSESPESIVNSENDVSELSINSTPPSPIEEHVLEHPSPDKREIIENNDIFEEPPLEPKCSKSNDTNFNNNDNDLINENVIEPKVTKEIESDDDFGDFDDFQFASSDVKSSAIVDACDNPWESDAHDAETNDFGNFTATFDTVEGPVTAETTPTNSSKSNHNNDLVENKTDDDDFGEFDDFQSSTHTELSENNDETQGDQMSILNLHMLGNESQITESITKIISSIYDEEVSDTESEFESKLETCLSVAWGHLRETDVRQPYMVNWNNSLGQKTLLKALCIDSRNILFGPKWSSNTPKYAANLSVAPLQPQKPSTPSTSHPETVTTEKTTPKDGTWSDPFTSDGHEFTYAEALLLDLEHLMATLDQMAHNHSTLKISELLSQACNTETERPAEVRPNSLEVFETMAPKPEKIYSSTLNVQPLRQINLPDTHIFTPTDSETPRSKTIHYDRGPPILLPQTPVESTRKDLPQPNEPLPSKEDDDYWEFQDFKGTEASVPSNSIPQETVELKPEPPLKPNVTYQTQVLQPIKMEPLMPTLNWPDPGEVKETFEDFTDFISNSNWNEQPSVPESSKPIEPNEITSNDNQQDVATKSETQLPNSKELDDDFDTFRSALPQKTEFTYNSLPSFNNIPTQNQTSQVADFDAFPKEFKADSTPVNNVAQSSNLGFSNTAERTPNKSPLSFTNQVQLPPSLLQPMSASSSTKPQKPTQILEPLSLESYSQINWPNPGFDLQDLSRFNPVETLQSLKSDLSMSGSSKVASPAHSQKGGGNQAGDDDIWGDFVSSKPKQQQLPKKQPVFADDDEWTEFVSSPSVKPLNGLNTISLNVHTNSNIQKTNVKFPVKSNQVPIDLPTLNYITPKASGHNYNNRHFQNL